MRFRLVGLTVIFGCGVLCLGLPAKAQNSVTMTAVNGSYSSGNLCSSQSGCAQVYTGLYYSTVNNTANTAVICDDFNHNVSVGENWQATALNTSSLNSTNIQQTEFGSGVNGQIAPVVYAEVASLVSEMFSLNNGSGAFDGLKNVTGTDLSEAIWDITTKGGITGISSNAAALVTYVENFFGKYSSTKALGYLNGLNLWILTPNPNNGPQEFWSQNGPSFNVPEGGSALLYLVLAGLVCFGAMFLKYRSEAGGQRVA